ncbi:MAG: hypothetical protein ACRY3E_06055 [Candidatus Lariskella arthropodorum]|uniref:hypothetical protein n=1 Tax=Candidatus Lariskella endosymbiont of Epinotia ramella TaxID=3066224 RepID=UPI0030D1F2B9
MSDSTTIVNQGDDNSLGALVKEGVDGLQVVLSTVGGPEGKIAAVAIEGVEMLFEGELEKLFDEGLDEIPELVERASGGKISAKSVGEMMSKVLRNETVDKLIESITKGISELIVTYIIQPIKQGLDFTTDKAIEFLGKLGAFAAPLKALAEQCDKNIDNMLDKVEENVRNTYKDLDASIDDFNRKYSREEVKSQLVQHVNKVIEPMQEATQQAQSAFGVLQPQALERGVSGEISEAVAKEAVQIMTAHGIQANGSNIDVPNAQESSLGKEQSAQRDVGHSR